MQDTKSLTEREIEILSLIADGKSNKDIAQTLHISANTVKVHLRNIFGKLEVSTRTEATMVALQMGLLPSASSPANDSEQPKGVEEKSSPPAIQKAEDSALSNLSSTIYAIGLLIIVILLTGIAYQISNPVEANATPDSSDVLALENQWNVRKNLPEARTRAAAVSYQDNIYLVGGEIIDQVTNETLLFNPNLETWSLLAEKITPVAEIQAAILGGKIYVPGGRLASGMVSDVLEIFDPIQNEWSKGPSLPVALSAYSLTVFEGKMYLFGGWNGTGYTDQVFSYDPDTITWRELTPMPSALGYTGSSVAAERIYVLGGYNGEKAQNTNFIYTPELEGQQPWSIGHELPEPRYALGQVSIADKIHLIGGLGSQNHIFSQMYYDPQFDNWEITENPLATEWAYVSVTSLGTQVFAIGGEANEIPTNRNLAFQALFIMMMPVIR